MASKALSYAESGGAYFVVLKASSPMAEYLTDASRASLAKSSATASSVSMVSRWECRVSMPVRYEKCLGAQIWGLSVLSWEGVQNTTRRVVSAVSKGVSSRASRVRYRLTPPSLIDSTVRLDRSHIGGPSPGRYVHTKVPRYSYLEFKDMDEIFTSSLNAPSLVKLSPAQVPSAFDIELSIKRTV